MFNLSNNDNISMGLSKMTTDYISMGREPVEYNSKEEMFRFNTSGSNTGIKDLIENQIRKQMGAMNKKSIRIDENDIYIMLKKKAESAASDFDPNKSNSLKSYCISLLNFVFEDIYKQIKKKEGDEVYDAFTTESDSKSDELETNTEMKMVQEGRIGVIDIDDKLDQDGNYWRETFIDSLFLILSLQKESFETKDSKLNLIRLIQAHYATMRDVEEKEFVESMLGSNKATQRSKARAGGKLASSLGLIYNASIMGKLQTVIPEDYNGDKRIYRAFKKFLDACVNLNLPIEFLDENLLTDEEYLQKLYFAFKNRKTINISEYDVLDFDSDINLTDIRKSFVRDELSKMGIDSKNFNMLYTDNLHEAVMKVRASDFMSLENALTESRNLYVSKKQMKHDKTMRKKEVKAVHKTVGQQVDDIWQGSKTHRTFQKELFHDIVVNGYTKVTSKGESTRLKGTLSPESIEIIKREIDNFKRTLTKYPGRHNFITTNSTGQKIKKPLDSEHLRELRALVRELVIMRSDKPIERDGFGFLRYIDTKYYIQIPDKEPFHSVGSSDDRFEFRNYLIHEDGFLVSKFLDGRITGNRDLKVYSACNKDTFEGLIIKTLHGHIIYKGQ